MGLARIVPTPTSISFHKLKSNKNSLKAIENCPKAKTSNAEKKRMGFPRKTIRCEKVKSAASLCALLLSCHRRARQLLHFRLTLLMLAPTPSIINYSLCSLIGIILHLLCAGSRIGLRLRLMTREHTSGTGLYSRDKRIKFLLQLFVVFFPLNAG